MKVIQSIEYLYEGQKGINEKLKAKVDDTFKVFMKPTWHYFSRVKELESYALKLETGRVSKPKKLEDFFGCTLVVENLNQINIAIISIKEYFTLDSRRPKDPKITHKHPSSFEFDDLRLYAYLKQPENMPEEPLTHVMFEIQMALLHESYTKNGLG
jgi:hypothetical protein